MKRQSTNKLFFGKFPYKVELKIKGAPVIKYRGVPWVKQYCTVDNFFVPQYRGGYWNDIDKVVLHKFVTTLEPYLAKGIKTRAENSTFSLYPADANTCEELEKVFNWCLIDVWAPESSVESEFLAGNRNKTIVEKLPYSKYAYRVEFKNQIPDNLKAQCFNWMSNYHDNQLKISRNSRLFFLNKKKMYSRPFIYIEDVKMLTMLSLILGDKIVKVTEYIPKHTLVP